MVLESLILSYVIKKTRDWKKRLKKAKNSEDLVEGDVKDNTKTKRSVISKVLMIWGFFECFSLILVLLRMVNNNDLVGFPENFLHELCNPHKRCQTIIIRIIFYKLLTSIALVVGLRYVRQFVFVT